MACAACGLTADVYDEDGRCALCSGDTRENGSSARIQAGQACTTEDVRNLSKLQRAALEAISEHGSMRAAADALGLNHAAISRALDGHGGRAVYRALSVRKTEGYTLAFRFRDRAGFERARAAVDAHPAGRAAWLLEHVRGREDADE